MRTPPPGGTAAATTVADVLTEFLRGNRGGLSITDVSRTLDLSKAVVHRIFQSLLDRDLVTFDERRRLYLPGPALLALGRAALRDSDLRNVAQPVLSRLQAQTRETATLSAVVGTQRLYLDQVVSPQELRMSVEMGPLLPLHVGSSGRAILAFLPPELQEVVLAGTLERHAQATITDPDVLRQELQRVRERRVAVSRGERLGVAGAIASPILDHNGIAIGAVGAVGPLVRFDDENVEAMIPLVIAAGEDVTRRMAERYAYTGPVADAP